MCKRLAKKNAPTLCYSTSDKELPVCFNRWHVADVLHGRYFSRWWKASYNVQSLIKEKCVWTLSKENNESQEHYSVKEKSVVRTPWQAVWTTAKRCHMWDAFHYRLQWSSLVWLIPKNLKQNKKTPCGYLEKSIFGTFWPSVYFLLQKI